VQLKSVASARILEPEFTNRMRTSSSGQCPPRDSPLMLASAARAQTFVTKARILTVPRVALQKENPSNLLQVERNERFIFNYENVLASKHPTPAP